MLQPYIVALFSMKMQPGRQKALTPALSHPMGEGEASSGSACSWVSEVSGHPARVSSLSHRMGEGRGEGFSVFLLRRFSFWLTVLFAASSVMISRGQVPPARTNRSPTSIPKAPAVQRLVDLNTASVEMLEALPGIGRTLANAIIAARPFTNVTELARVKGVGEAKAAGLRGRVMVSRLPPGYRPPPSAVGFQKPPANIPARPASSAAAASAGKVNLNSAPKEVLEKLPGIGPALADAIIAQRPYQTVEDIMKVRGIKAGRFERIKNLISAE